MCHGTVVPARWYRHGHGGPPAAGDTEMPGPPASPRLSVAGGKRAAAASAPGPGLGPVGPATPSRWQPRSLARARRRAGASGATFVDSDARAGVSA